MSGFPPVKTDGTDAFFRAFKAGSRIEAERYKVVAFGDSAAMADEVLELGARRHQARHGVARTVQDGGGDRRQLTDGGFTNIRDARLPLQPVPAVCVLANRPAAG